MAELGVRLQRFLEALDLSPEPTSESRVPGDLCKLSEDHPEASSDDQAAFRAESLAFLVMVDCQGARGAWGTYYGPAGVLQNEEGTLLSSPDLELVTQEVVAYWGIRAKASRRPLLRLRYADLVWDLSRRACGLAPDVEYAHIAIDATLDLIDRQDYDYEVNAVKKLTRAISLALSIGDRERIAAVRDAMIAFEDLVADDGRPGLWGFSLETLAANRKVPLSVHQLSKLIANMEARLERVSAVGARAPDPHIVEAAAMHLVRCYRRQKQSREVQRVLRILGRSYVSAAETVVPFVGAAWLKQMFDLYQHEGMNEEADALNTRLAELSKRALEDMHAFSFEMPVPVRQVEVYLSALTEGSLHHVLTRVARHFLPDHEQAIARVREGAKEASPQALFNHTVVDDDGRMVASVGSVDEDLDGRVMCQMGHDLGIAAVFLRQVLNRLITKFAPSTDLVLDYLYESPVFGADARPLLSVGIDALLKGDHAVAAHVLIPQVESALRQLLGLTGGALYRPHRLGGLALKNLDDILSDKGVKTVLGDDCVRYLRCLLTDPRGWNLRNTVCHGMVGVDTLSPATSDRLLHVLLMLAQTRRKPITDAMPSAEEEETKDES